MPFTPFHLGPALCLGIPLRKYIHAPTFILANVILDVEPFLVIVWGLNYPLHGYLHTLVASFGIGVALGLVMFFLERFLNPAYTMLLLEKEPVVGKLRFITAGVAGTALHLLFDSPLYGDVKPFYPLMANPLLGVASSTEVYLLSFWMGILGGVFYLIVLAFHVYKKTRKKLKAQKRSDA